MDKGKAEFFYFSTPIRGKRLLILFVLLVYGCSSTEAPSIRTPDSTTQKHLRELISTLPPDSSVRRSLEAGAIGNGSREAWMNDMSGAGLLEVMFEIHGVWRTGLGFHPIGVQRIIYRSKYDGPSAQVTDPSQIETFVKSGLQAKLQGIAFAKSRNARWPMEARFSLLGVKCFVDVYLFDDEWVNDVWRSTSTPVLGSYDPSAAPLLEAAKIGDVVSTSVLLKTERFSKSSLSKALFDAVAYPSDNTDVIRMLLAAGADPNATREEGTSVLMESIDHWNAHNIRFLITAGADPSLKNRAGDTASSKLSAAIKQALRSGQVPPYVEELGSVLGSSD
jgi:hypothetical protein